MKSGYARSIAIMVVVGITMPVALAQQGFQNARAACVVGGGRSVK